jgi:uncharacterized membrane protein
MPMGATATSAPPLPPPTSRAFAAAELPDRIRSIDVVRGLVCVLMAIDHVRVYSGLPAGGPSPGIFLTRWVTHFVAPVFCFFAGTGAYFLGKRLKDTAALRKFLVTRGLLLVVLELTLIRFLWAFHIGPDFMLAGVIWMLGWCMVLLGLFVGMSARRVGSIGVGIVLLQQLFFLPGRFIPAIASPWSFIYNSPAESAPFGINVLYVLVPWIGVMMAGFGFGVLMQRDDEPRKRVLTRLGVGMTATWIVIATTIALVSGGSGGEAGGEVEAASPLWMSVLNQQKYPASQLFLLMTLGPMIALLPYAERWKGWAGRALEIFGRVPMWYYLMHLLVIHTVALVVNAMRGHGFNNGWFTTAPYTQVPPEGTWNLGLLYVVWAACILILYPLSKWYADRKRANPAPWMKYI